jgi:hypothetical protein
MCFGMSSSLVKSLWGINLLRIIDGRSHLCLISNRGFTVIITEIICQRYVKLRVIGCLKLKIFERICRKRKAGEFSHGKYATVHQIEIRSPHLSHKKLSYFITRHKFRNQTSSEDFKLTIFNVSGRYLFCIAGVSFFQEEILYKLKEVWDKILR